LYTLRIIYHRVNSQGVPCLTLSFDGEKSYYFCLELNSERTWLKMLSFTWFVMRVACDGRRIFLDSRRASCSWSVGGRWICICVELNRRDYELIIISRSSIYGSVDHKRSAIEISLALSLTDEESGLVEMFLEVLERGEVPVWWVLCCICFSQWGYIVDETLGVRWDGYGIHMVGKVKWDW